MYEDDINNIINYYCIDYKYLLLTNRELNNIKKALCTYENNINSLFSISIKKLCSYS